MPIEVPLTRKVSVRDRGNNQPGLDESSPEPTIKIRYFCLLKLEVVLN